MTLHAISPLDGRYQPLTEPLGEYFSEFALMRYRVTIEIRWLMHLASDKQITHIPPLSKAQEILCQQWIADFSLEDAQAIKQHEAQCQHDLKAVEYFLRDRLEKHGMAAYKGFVHFCCTSEDINNLAYSLMLQDARDAIILPHLNTLKEQLIEQALAHKSQIMLARTHGQPALPTTLGKEYAVFALRLHKAITSLKSIPMMGKCNGAVGNYHAHHTAYPTLDWPTICGAFVRSLGLTHQTTSTQIEPQDERARFMQALAGINRICLDFSRDFWLYLSFGYFKQSATKHQVGSSTMPQKINPIHFENAEGNLSISTALLDCLAHQLPQSRLQRDLSGSTLLRNMGVALAHSDIGIQMIIKGIKTLTPHQKNMQKDCANHYELLAESVQILLKLEGHDGAYDQVRLWTQGQSLDQSTYLARIDELPIDDHLKKQLKQLKPDEHIGRAVMITEATCKHIQDSQ
jgi:adenylosuccinate lyase